MTTTPPASGHGGIEIRPAAAGDGHAIVDLVNLAEPYLPIGYTLSDIAITANAIPAGALDRRLVATAAIDGGETIVGHGWLRDEHWPQDAYFMELRVDPTITRRGVGSRLLAALLQAADPGIRSEVAAFASESSPGGVAFLGARGFSERYRFVKWRIDPTTFVVPARLTPLAGIRLTNLAAVDSPVARRAVFDMIMEASHDVPSPDAMPPRGYEEWEQAVFDADRFDPTTILLAMDGDQPVGYCRLEIDGIKAWNHFTAVARSHRGRGIAMNLKVHSIRTMAERGVRELNTENNTGNTGMLAINERLGFEKTSSDIRFGRDLRP